MIHSMGIDKSEDGFSEKQIGFICSLQPSSQSYRAGKL